MLNAVRQSGVALATMLAPWWEIARRTAPIAATTTSLGPLAPAVAHALDVVARREPPSSVAAAVRAVASEAGTDAHFAARVLRDAFPVEARREGVLVDEALALGAEGLLSCAALGETP